MTKKRAIDVLGKVPLFHGLSKRELEHIFRETEEETFSAGTRIVSEGESGGRFFVLLEGRASVSIGDRKRGRLGPGDFFGEMSLIDGQPRSATVTADSYVVARSIAPWNFLALLEENWPMNRKVLVALTRRIREMEKSPAL